MEKKTKLIIVGAIAFLVAIGFVLASVSLIRKDPQQISLKDVAKNVPKITEGDDGGGVLDFTDLRTAIISGCYNTSSGLNCGNPISCPGTIETRDYPIIKQNETECIRGRTPPTASCASLGFSSACAIGCTTPETCDECECRCRGVDLWCADATGSSVLRGYGFSQACRVEANSPMCCVPNWTCDPWTDCTAECDGGTQTRMCRDGCGGIRPESRTCNEQPCPKCGDNIVQPGPPRYEECDDGNEDNGDGCEANCTKPECNQVCTNAIGCDGTLSCYATRCRNSSCNLETDCACPRCGDGHLDPGEECDDGNQISGDGCQANCTKPECNQVCTNVIGCDGNLACSNGRCRNQSCAAETDCTCCVPDWTCGSWGDCSAECDGGIQSRSCSDGCGGTRTDDQTCNEQPCPRCGDGHLDPGEECDDGNEENGDGCEANCTRPDRCNDGCTNAIGCSGGFTCSGGHCRNSSCPSEADCTCCVPNWTCDPWGTCSKLCGKGTQSRACEDGCGDTRSESQNCNRQLCQCNEICADNGDCEGDLTCSNGRCRNQACTAETDCTCPCIPNWTCDSWGNCSKQCGGGTQSRSCEDGCGNTDTRNQNCNEELCQCNETCSDNGDCEGGLICSNGSCRNSSCTAETDCTCPCIPNWTCDSWGNCSKQCGGGTQSRSCEDGCGNTDTRNQNCNEELCQCNETCSDNGDCEGGLICSNGSCRNSSCTAETDCTCPVGCNETCSSSADCSGGLTCSGGHCRNQACTGEADCVCATCGDGNLDPGEECDDGNNVDGDGCDANCTKPKNCNDTCTASIGCDGSYICSGGHCRNQACTGEADCVCATCGDGNLDPGEECDDGNNAGGDGCEADCTKPENCNDTCIDTIGCDGDWTCSDGQCRNDSCLEEADCICPNCGDGNLDPGEECDDGNNVDGDGCDSSCRIETEEPEEPDDPKDCESSIGNYVWYDENGDGVQDAGEPGISGVKICAYDGNDKDCDTTDSDGRYKIKDLDKGTYDVRVKTEGVAGLTQTYDPDGKLDDKTDVKLKCNDDHTKADFGYRGVAPATGIGTSIAVVLMTSLAVTAGIMVLLVKLGKI